MRELILSRNAGAPLKVLCLGAHSDDIEIGCGGSILTLARRYRNASFRWVVFGADEKKRAVEATRSAGIFLREARRKQVTILAFRSSFFPYRGEGIKECFEELKREFEPDLIFTHCRHDLHQDHRVICELTWNTFRSHLILEYEIPKYDGDLGGPNAFMPIDERTAKRKVGTILRVFRSQRRRRWFTADLFYALLRLRGIESGSSGKYAEAFYCRKAALL